MTNSIADIVEADLLLVTGSNTTEAHPVIGLQMKKAVRRYGATLILIDPREIELANFAALHLRPRPGSDVALLNAMAHVIIKEGWYDCEFIAARTEQFDAFARAVAAWTPERASAISEVPCDLIVEAARRYAQAGSAAIFWALVEEARQYSLAEVAPGEEHRTFYALSVPKKLVVMLGGPVMNLLIAVVLIAVVMVGFGVPAYTATLGNVQECLPADPAATECRDTDPPAPGALAGLRPGDTVLSWGGRPVTGWDDVRAAIADAGTSPATVVVERDGQERTLTVTAATVDRPVVVDGEVLTDADGEPVTEPRPFVGIGPTAALERRPLGAVPARVGEALGATVDVVLTLPQRIVAVAQAAFGQEERDPGVVGLVGVGRFAGEIASIDSERYGVAERTADMLGLLASLNLALFVFNLLPLLPLDGGHIAGALWEGLRRRVAVWRNRPDPGPVDVARLLPVTYVVVVVMVGMSLLLAYADIVRPVTLTG